MKLEDIILLSAMGPPGGGRTFITNRLVRHYNVLSYTELDSETARQIFDALVGSFLRRFAEAARNLVPQIVQSVLGV